MAIIEGLERPQSGAFWAPIQIAVCLWLVAGCTPETVEPAQAPIAETKADDGDFEQVASQPRPSSTEVYRRHIAAQEKDSEELAQRRSEGVEVARLMSLRPDPDYEAWLTAIHEKINEAWNQLGTEAAGFECEVRMALVPSMEVVKADILRCDADDAKRSLIILAVGRASPLPKPPKPEMFERYIIVAFRPTGS